VGILPPDTVQKKKTMATQDELDDAIAALDGQVSVDSLPFA